MLKAYVVAASIAAMSMVVGTVSFAANPIAPADETSPAFYKAAADYCVHTAGVVETRIAQYGSNGPNPLQLAGIRQFCQYTKSTDGSRIHLLTTTLFTQKPTLAALAYYAKLPVGSCQGNPASCYCTLLGGSDQFGGTTGAGGGWFLKGAIDETLEACIFPDMSSIDSWGLAYHTNNIIRGKDLAKVLRFKNPY
jgi:hypothetical protein